MVNVFCFGNITCFAIQYARFLSCMCRARHIHGERPLTASIQALHDVKVHRIPHFRHIYPISFHLLTTLKNTNSPRQEPPTCHKQKSVVPGMTQRFSIYGLILIAYLATAVTLG